MSGIIGNSLKNKILSFFKISYFTRLLLKGLGRSLVWTIVLTFTFSPVVRVCFKKVCITRTVVASLSVGTRLHAVICWYTFVYIYKNKL